MGPDNLKSGSSQSEEGLWKAGATEKKRQMSMHNGPEEETVSLVHGGERQNGDYTRKSLGIKMQVLYDAGCGQRG